MTAPLAIKNFGFRSLLPWLAVLAVAWLTEFTIVPFLGADKLDILTLAGISIILAASLNLVNGFTGQFSMGHAGFMAVGAYTSAFFSDRLLQQMPEVLSTPVAGPLFFIAIMFLSGLIAMAMGYMVGLPSLRLRGDYLAIVTLGFGEIIRVIFLNMDVVGGARGYPGLAKITNFGWVYSMAVLTVFVVWRVVNSSHGRACLAVREDEIAAESMGVDTTQAKVRAFALGAFFAGIAGSLFAHHLTFITPSIFDFNRSFEIIIMVVLGGMGSLSGSVFAAFMLTFLREYLRDLQEYTKVDLRMIIYSLILIILMLTRPNGLFGTREIHQILARFLNREKSQTVKGATT